MATRVYIDGFNLYYRRLKGTPYRWLNLRRLCELLLPDHDVQRVKYFTARVTALPHDARQPQRQQIYLRALATLSPEVEVIYGRFVSHVVTRPLADGTGWVEVIDAEEKGSDVALAVHLLHDAHRDAFDRAVVINDSDLAPCVQIVKAELGKQVHVVCPARHICRDLVEAASSWQRIRTWVLEQSQFDPTLTDATGPFHKPSSW